MNVLDQIAAALDPRAFEPIQVESTPFKEHNMLMRRGIARKKASLVLEIFSGAWRLLADPPEHENPSSDKLLMFSPSWGVHFGYHILKSDGVEEWHVNTLSAGEVKAFSHWMPLPLPPHQQQLAYTGADPYEEFR